MSAFFELLDNPVAIVFGFLSVCVVMDAIVKISKQGGGGRILGKASKDAAHRNQSEAREMQELRSGFEDMAQRIESLETILLERGKKE